MRPKHIPANAIRALLVVTAGIGCAASAVSCAPSGRVGLRTLGSADTSRPVQISATRSVAVAYTPAHDGQLDAVDVVASRAGAGPVGLLAYLVTPDDPASGGPAEPVAAPAGAEPECWGYVADSALSSSARALTIYGAPCPVLAGHKYWVQLSSALGPADLYPRQASGAGPVLVRQAPGATWKAADVTGGLDVSPVTHATL